MSCQNSNSLFFNKNFRVQNKAGNTYPWVLFGAENNPCQTLSLVDNFPLTNLPTLPTPLRMANSVLLLK